MAKEIPDLVAVARTGTGKGAARQARRNGMVPGVVYGGLLHAGGGQAAGIEAESRIDSLQLILAQQWPELVEPFFQTNHHRGAWVVTGAGFSKLRFYVEQLLQQTLVHIADG